MKIRFLTLLTTLVFLGFTVTAIAKKPSSPPVDDSVVYTVELTGVYTIPAHEAHEVTLNSRGYLKSLDTEPLVFERPETAGDEQDAWDAVIEDCAGNIIDDSDDPMPMLVNFDDWAVGRNGDDGILWINLKNIRLPDLVPEKEIQIHLRRVGGVAGNPKFLPDPGESITHILDSYVVWGKPLIGKGKKGWDTCYHPDLESDETFLPAELVITYIGVPE
jgi:hypothetical protein